MKTKTRTTALAASAASVALLLAACGETEAGESAQAEDENVVDDTWADCVPGSESVDLTGEEPGDENLELTVAMFNGWDDSVASSHLAQYMLERLGYEVEVEAFDPAPGFTGTAEGDIDWVASSMLPSTHADYMEQFGDELESQGCWYAAATNEIAVNEDSPAQTIADLAEMGDEYGNQIVGIEPGAGLMRLTHDSVMPAYGLDDWVLVESSTPAMLASVQQAANSGENIAVTMWHPHWAYESLPLRDLEDTEGAFGEPEQLFQLSRSGFSEEQPFASAVLKNLAVDEETMSSLQYVMSSPDEFDGEDHAEAVEVWAEDNQEFFDDWEAGLLEEAAE